MKASNINSYKFKTIMKKMRRSATPLGYAKNWVMAAILTLFGTFVFTGCSTDDDDNPAVEQEYTGVPLVILDTDIGSSTDDLFSLEMLHYYQQQGRCKLLGVIVDREGEDCAACADVMNTYFNYSDVPIGLVRNGIKNPSVWINYKALPTYTKADGTPMFARSIGDYSALPDGWQLYRRLLAAQPDHSVSICSIGFTACLAQLLESVGDTYSPLSGVELVRSKVKRLYIQGGSFGQSPEPDFNFLQGMEFAKTFFRLWPSDVDIIFDPMETGNGIEYLPEQVISDVSWTDYHPIKQVYMNCNCNTGQMMWDPLTVINAVEGDNLFTLTERGTVVLNDDGTVIFTHSATGNSRFQMPGDDAWRSTMLEKIRNVNKAH
jgi:inosine-uridine nucleoside N-ribohydrolase